MNRFGYTIFYVHDVAQTMAFFEKAFGTKTAFIDPSGQYGQLETGTTALGFASFELAKINLPHSFRPLSPKELPGCASKAMGTNNRLHPRPEWHPH